MRELLEDRELHDGPLLGEFFQRRVVVEIVESLTPSQLIQADRGLLSLWQQGLELAVDDSTGETRDALVARAVRADWIKLARPLIIRLPDSDAAFVWSGVWSATPD